MRHDVRMIATDRRVAVLNDRFRDSDPDAILKQSLVDGQGRTAVVSSFGADSVVLLHLISKIDRTIPVLFLDTEMLFRSTLKYQTEVAEALGLTDVRRITAERTATFEADPEGDLHRRDPDACCSLRKTVPLQHVLSGFDVWITGRKRFQTADRSQLQPFEVDGAGRIKVNPLARWGRDDLRDYIKSHRLPRHPLVYEGYPSIGCAPCTSKVRAGEDERAGRWRGAEKEECGIHFVDGKVVRVV